MTARPRRTTKTKTKKTVEPRRLPAAVRITGEVLMDRPPEPGALAHRRPIVSDVEDGVVRSPVLGTLTAACRPLVDSQTPRPYAQFSAGWVDHTYQAIACPDCFPEATP